MTSELRWILLGLSLPLLAAIWWWTSRRSRQGKGKPELREVGQAPEFTREPEFTDEGVHPIIRDEPGGWGVPPFEPLSIRTADFDDVPAADHPPMTAHPEPLADRGYSGEARRDPAVPVHSRVTEAVSPAAEAVAQPSPAPAPREPASRELSAAREASAQRQAAVTREAVAHRETAATGNRPQLPNTAETQRIVSLRVCAASDTRWSGVQLLAALNDHGLAHGRYQVFHRKHGDGRTLFCAASLVEPGTFDLARMPGEEYRGLTLFAVLPGPIDAVQTVDALIDTADGLAQALGGEIQDSKGQPLTPEAADALRDDVERFQVMLAMN